MAQASGEHSLRILVADDEYIIRQLVIAGFQQENYKVIQASDGEEALQVFEETLPDLMILDINMPKLNGFEVCRRIRERSDVPIMMLSARDAEEDREEGRRVGANDYLAKPFSIEDLVARSQALLRGAREAKEE